MVAIDVRERPQETADPIRNLLKGASQKVTLVMSTPAKAVARVPGGPPYDWTH